MALAVAVGVGLLIGRIERGSGVVHGTESRAAIIDRAIMSAKFVAGTVTGLLLLHALFGKWRAVKVFVAYQSENVEFATDLSDGLSRHGLRVTILALKDPQHDEVVAAVRSGIRWCDAVVVLPTTRASFVDAEIMAASVSNKIIVLLMDESARLPNTAYSGYPQFSVARTKPDDFAAIAAFLKFVSGRLPSLFRLAAEHAALTGIVVFGSFAVSIVLVNVVGLIAALIGRSLGESYHDTAAVIRSVTVAGTLAIAVIWADLKRLRSARIARQITRTGGATYDALIACLPEADDVVAGLHPNYLASADRRERN